MRQIRKRHSALLAVLFVCAMIPAGISGWKLYRYYADYADDRGRYQDLREEVIFESGEGMGGQREAASGTGIPFSANWEALKQINEDIIGWIYFTGLPQISYPVLQAQDNSFYLDRTYDLSGSSKAGSIFLDYRMNGDFSSPYSVIYGHNVRDGSMFSGLAGLRDQELYDREPYFWILTPEGNYQYRIFSVFQCHRSADVFQKSFDSWGEAFSEWEQELKKRNLMQGDEPLLEDDHVVVCSTCVPDSFDRTIICGRCISDERPPR